MNDDECWFCHGPINPQALEVCSACQRYTPRAFALRGELTAEQYEQHQVLLKEDAAYAATHYLQAGPVPPDDEGPANAGSGSFGGGWGAC